MALFWSIIVLMSVGLSQYPARIMADGSPDQANAEKTPKIEESFSYDWPIHSNLYVAFTDRFTFERKFIFMLYNPFNGEGLVYLVSTDHNSVAPNVPEIKYCKVKMDKPNNRYVILYEIGLGKLGNSDAIVIEWTTNGDDAVDKTTEIDLYDCNYDPIIQHSSVLQDSDGVPLDFVMQMRSKMQFAEVNSTQGFVIVDTKNEGNETIDKLTFKELATKEIKQLGNIKLDSSLDGLDKRKSYDNDKLGTCWMNSVRVLCRQDDMDGDEIMGMSKVQLKEEVDWFSVYNLATPAMLLITGNCPNDNCDEFSVRKVEANDKVSKEITIDGLDVHCVDSHNELVLSMTVNEMATFENNPFMMTCFNLVCAESYYLPNTNRKKGVIMQYRRKCIKEDFYK